MLRQSLTLILAVVIAAIIKGGPAQADASPFTADYQFDAWIDLQLDTRGMPRFETVQFFLQSEEDANTWSTPALTPEGDLVSYRFIPTELNLRAFTKLVYWYEITDNNGKTSASPKQPLSYEDNRFEWKQRSQGGFEVYWHTGDSAFAQNILDTMQLGLEKIKTIIPVPDPEKVRIYVYDNPADLRSTLRGSGPNWVGAHTDPDLGVMVVSLPEGPEQRLEMERQIPHELMHIMLYQKLGPAYLNLPTWLNEGLASVAELYPNPDYLVLINSSLERDDLIPITSLCNTFPREAAGAYLAYAESASFTRFIQLQYGSILLDQIVQQYANGLDCSRGVEVALGKTLSEVEREWQRESLGDDPWFTALRNLAPWLVLLVAVLVVPVTLVLVTLRSNPGKVS
jgi:hypothetical protein